MRTISRYNQKTDTTAQLYCTLSMCITSKTISRQNQITNTPPQLYCTLSSTCVCRSKPFSHQDQKLTQHNSTTGKKVPPAHAKQVFPRFLCSFANIICRILRIYLVVNSVVFLSNMFMVGVPYFLEELLWEPWAYSQNLFSFQSY